MSRLYKPAKAIEVEVDEQGQPVALRWRGVHYRGRQHDHWRIHTGWWEEEVWRDYYLWESQDLLCEVYQNRLKGDWYMHRVYD